MELKITSMTPADRLYAYNQSSQLEGQTGCIGHLRGDFGSGQEFYTSWFDHRSEYKTDEFKAEFDEVVNTLREKDGLLCTRDSMTRFCYQNPEAEFEGNYCAEYGFKVQTPQHTYMLRCNPNYGDYNFYLYAYVARFLEHHMENAKQGIRFITPGYKFKIIDYLVTNFHLPKSTLFMLVCAVSGTDAMKAGYRHAMDKKYRFYSYGDSSILKCVNKI